MFPSHSFFNKQHTSSSSLILNKPINDTEFFIKRSRKRSLFLLLSPSSDSDEYMTHQECSFSASQSDNNHPHNSPSNISESPINLSHYSPLPPILLDRYDPKANKTDFNADVDRNPASTRSHLSRAAKENKRIDYGLKPEFWKKAEMITAIFNGSIPPLSNAQELSTDQLIQSINNHNIKHPITQETQRSPTFLNAIISSSSPLFIDTENPNWIKSSSIDTDESCKNLHKIIQENGISSAQFIHSTVQCNVNSSLRVVCDVECCDYFRFDHRDEEKIEKDKKNGITSRPECEGALVRLTLQETLMKELLNVQRPFKPVVKIVKIEEIGFSIVYLGYVKNGGSIGKVIKRAWKPEFGPLCAYQGEIIFNKQMEEQLHKGNKYLARVSKDVVIDSSSSVLGNLAAFINRSCQPNSQFNIWLMNNRPYIMVEVLPEQTIEPGKHITVNYELPEGAKCLCAMMENESRKCCLSSLRCQELTSISSL